MKRMETQAKRLITILTKAEQTHLPRKRLSRIPCLAPNPIKIKIKKKKNQVRKRIRNVINTVDSQELSKGGPTKNQATKRRQGTKSRNESFAGPAGLKGKGGRSVLQGTQLDNCGCWVGGTQLGRKVALGDLLYGAAQHTHQRDHEEGKATTKRSSAIITLLHTWSSLTCSCAQAARNHPTKSDKHAHRRDLCATWKGLGLRNECSPQRTLCSLPLTSSLAQEKHTVLPT